jgi:hypothetical protein
MHKHIPPDHPWWNPVHWSETVKLWIGSISSAPLGLLARKIFKSGRDKYKSTREAEQIQLPKRRRKR